MPKAQQLFEQLFKTADVFDTAEKLPLPLPVPAALQPSARGIGKALGLKEHETLADLIGKHLGKYPESVVRAGTLPGILDTGYKAGRDTLRSLRTMNEPVNKLGLPQEPVNAPPGDKSSLLPYTVGGAGAGALGSVLYGKLQDKPDLRRDLVSALLGGVAGAGVSLLSKEGSDRSAAMSVMAEAVRKHPWYKG